MGAWLNIWEHDEKFGSMIKYLGEHDTEIKLETVEIRAGNTKAMVIARMIG